MFSRLRPCLLCQRWPCRPQTALCQACFDDLPWQQTWQKIADLEVYGHFRYEWPIDRLIHLIKYDQQLVWLPALGLTCAAKPPQPIDALLPVPLAQSRLQKRGFNQSALIAQHLSKHWNIPIWQGATRTRATLNQQQLREHERRDNLAGAFAIADHPPARLLLIDDVCTTGSTLSTLAAACREAGCQHVAAWVIASHSR